MKKLTQPPDEIEEYKNIKLSPNYKILISQNQDH